MNQQERGERWADGKGYDSYIQGELHSFRKEAWKQQLRQHLPKKNLQILAVGTGPGFFSCILSELGYRATGIDASEGMLACARKNAECLQVTPEFLLMDVNSLTFPDESFDVLVMRNVTWTLEHPEKVYSEFKRLLKPRGMLLIYDANWQLQFFDPDLRQRVLAREKAYREKYGREEFVSRGDMAYYATAPLTHTYRPDWDREVLTNLGFEVSIEENIGRRVYEQWEKDLYAESPLFEICAVKKAEPETQTNMHTYWQKRAETFGFFRKPEDVDAMGREYARYLPEGPLQVLDAGTGTGVIAAVMAKLGHKVTAVDLCSNMLEKAKENLRSLGLQADFYCTSAGELPFPDESFDVVISRNVTWALPEPEHVMEQWRRVLKPGGLLIYRDANHYNYLFFEEDRQNRERIIELAGTPHGDHNDSKEYDYNLCDETAYNLPMSKLKRPGQWDDIMLPKLGFDILAEELRYPQRLLKYGIADGYYTDFTIVARKAETIEE
ncbi:MAG: methyltransferase domain-containing protein [Oscillospiraceae bacterium]|nr:methyltransferase domain-containing protein [Oscillospiraceae bacterium]